MNWLWAIIVATIIYMVVGMIWYADAFFGKEWRRLNKMTAKDLKGGMSKTIIGGIILGLIISYFLACFMDASRSYTFMQGAALAFWFWLGFVATTLFAGFLWGKKPFKLFLIDAGCYLITYILMGGVIAIMLK